MKYDKDKVDEMTLALLYLTSTHDQFGTRAWKGLERETFDRLIQKGVYQRPRNQITDDDVERGRRKVIEGIVLQIFWNKGGKT
ncbi:MAG TPA: hypothetical protein VMJ90_01940 [Anaerolineales bacterium]|nr:hypothetical protein [Anaerolineales bacterium]